MRHLTWLILAGALLAPAAFGQDAEAPGSEEMEQRLAMREREAEVEFGIQRQELELKHMEARLDTERADRTKRSRHSAKAHCGGLVLWLLVVNILLTIWVYKDMHEKKISRALWVPIVLLTGLGGALIYAIVRLGDTTKA